MGPQSRNQNANWPRVSGCASARRPLGASGDDSLDRGGGVPVPAPTSGLAGCGSAIRRRRHPAPAPRGLLPRKMNIQPRPPPQSEPVVSAAPPARGQLAHARTRLSPGRGAGGSGARAAAARLPEPHSRRAPARTLPGRPARRALPAGVRGPAEPPRTRSLRAATGARAPPPCTRSRLGRARTLPGATLRPWSSVTAGGAGARSGRAWTPEPSGAGEGGDNGSSGS
ncbi:uncharacterized protein C10orf95-like [Hyaena hyaena]|uniref:uncharacterized protein C10orf95-like n=1 Tax=Hyaena hyaena TaxID=95912 RepID=UPI001921D37B|nr:uncharacterized protein C10orf95-like [Hyaena hyaena]